MPYIDGRTLADVMGDRGPLPAGKAARLAADVARALQAAHDRRAVHRDLKPANVRVDGGGRPVVTDFGLAVPTTRSADPRLTGSGVILGTPKYMAPNRRRVEQRGRRQTYTLWGPSCTSC